MSKFKPKDRVVATDGVSPGSHGVVLRHRHDDVYEVRYDCGFFDQIYGRMLVLEEFHDPFDVDAG